MTKTKQGYQSGQLTVLFRAPKRAGLWGYWVCRCTCGNLCEVQHARLTRAARHCGCNTAEDRYGGPHSATGKASTHYMAWVKPDFGILKPLLPSDLQLPPEECAYRATCPDKLPLDSITQRPHGE